MKQLSSWASRNILAARWLIFGCYVSANLLGDVWALWLHAAGIEISSACVGSIILITIPALLLHPRKGRTKAAYYTYAWHKACDFVLCLATIVLVALATDGAIKTVTPAQASFRYKEVSVSSSGQHSGERKAQGLLRVLQNVKHWYQEMPIWGKVLLMILTITLTVMFCGIWAGVCCEISCSGAEALAGVLLFLGWGGMITGCVFICRRIVRGPRYVGPRVLTK